MLNLGLFALTSISASQAVALVKDTDPTAGAVTLSPFIAASISCFTGARH